MKMAEGEFGPQCEVKEDKGRIQKISISLLYVYILYYMLAANPLTTRTVLLTRVAQETAKG